MITRVVHVTEARGIAGTERSLLMLLDYADRGQFEHVVVCRGSGALADELRRRSVQIAMIPRWGRLDPIALVHFGFLLSKLNPDVVHIHGGRLEAVVARIFGIPVIERKNVCRNRYYRPLLNFRFVDRLLSGLVDVSITPAAAVRIHYIERGYSPRRVRVVYNGVEAAPPRTADWLQGKRAELGVPQDAFLVAFAGRLMPEKGVDVLLQALAKTQPNVWCILAGEGPHRARYEEQARELGLSGRVRFLDFRSDVREIFACADVVAVPSASEPLANVALEAMAEGRAVIATAVEGMPEAVEHEVTGLLVPPGDADAFAGAIGRLARLPEEAREMGVSGKVRANCDLSPERMVSETEAIYGDLLGTNLHERKRDAAVCRETPSKMPVRRGAVANRSVQQHALPAARRLVHSSHP